MSRETCSGQAQAVGVVPPSRCRGRAIVDLRLLIIGLMLALAGCATTDRPPPSAPPVHIPESTWWQVDHDIGTASLAGAHLAANYARGAMADWKNSVRDRTETDFIPWFSGYWTQQWLAIKVAWYKLGTEEGKNSAVRRLTSYLLEQYHERVLDPVAEEIDPKVVREQAIARYVRFLGTQLQEIPLRYGVPLDQFDRRIGDIPAIAPMAPQNRGASLYQVVHADPIGALPAYADLIAQIRKAAGRGEAEPLDARIEPVAKQTSERLVTRLAASGGASAAAAAIGGAGGVIISLGAAGFGVIRHNKERPEMETQLRESLNAALHDMHLGLTEDPVTGVMAGVHHISEQIDSALSHPLQLPVGIEAIPREAPRPEQRPLRDDMSDEEAFFYRLSSDD